MISSRDAKIERRLKAILFVDVVRYSWMMGEDELGTHLRTREIIADSAELEVNRHRGAVIKTTGDGLLAAFDSVFDAFDAAVEMQKNSGKRNAGIPARKRLQMRVGLHVGDIIVDEGDIFGEGVNIASRLESFATPGTICVSGRAWEDLRRLPHRFKDLGEQNLKNIRYPVRIFSHAPLRSTLVKP